MILAALLAFSFPAQANPPTSAVIGTPPQPDWAGLTIEQRKILMPLAGEWNQMEHIRRKQWLTTASRYPTMGAKEQERVQKRMRDWSTMTPEQRKRARDNYRDLSKLPSEHQEQIKKKWSAYKNLPEEEKQGVRERHKSAILLAPPPAPEPAVSEETPSPAQ